MSMESAIAFYEKLESDPSLAESLQGKTAEDIKRFVKEELGYDFSREEMQKVIFERNPEMTDEELEFVVGGLSDEALLTGAVAGTCGLLIGGIASGIAFIAAAA